MKKYKLLKDLPDHNIGNIHTEEYWAKWGKVHNFINQINNKEWFEEISPLFFTEEGTPIYDGEKSYFIDISSKNVDDQWLAWDGDSSYSTTRYFSDRNNALEYLNKLKWKKKLKFKIGDKIKTNNEYCTILKCDFLRELYVVKDSKSENEDAIFFKNQDNFELYNVKNSFGFLGRRSHLETIMEEPSAKEVAEREGFKIGDMVISIPNTHYPTSQVKTIHSFYYLPDDQIGFICTKGSYNPLEDFKPYLKIGKWYEYKGDYMCYQGDDKDYGICDDMWIQGDWIYHKNWKLADPEKVKRLLVEKVKKDYPVGTKISLLSYHSVKDVATIEFDKYHYGTVDGEYIICVQKNKLKTNSRDFFIYNNGEWAEIVEKPIHQNPDNTFVYKSNFKKNNIYYFLSAQKSAYLFKLDRFTKEGIISQSDLFYGSKQFSKEMGLLVDFEDIKNNLILRKATQSEKEWFEKCERLGKYVPIDYKENKFPTITDSDFKIGDKVKVIDEGEQYCDYKEAFVALNFNKNSYDYNSTEGDYGNISNIIKNPNTKRTMMVIKLLNERASQILIAKEGIALYRFTIENGVDRFIGDPFYSVNLRTLKLGYWEDDFSRVIDYKFIVDKETNSIDEKSKLFSTLEAAENFIKVERKKREKSNYKIGDKLWNTATKKYKGEIVDLYLDNENNLLCNTDLQTSILLGENSFITNKVSIIVSNKVDYYFMYKILNKRYPMHPECNDMNGIAICINEKGWNTIKIFKNRNYLLLTTEEYFRSFN